MDEDYRSSTAIEESEEQFLAKLLRVVTEVETGDILAVVNMKFSRKLIFDKQ